MIQQRSYSIQLKKSGRKTLKPQKPEEQQYFKNKILHFTPVPCLVANDVISRDWQPM